MLKTVKIGEKEVNLLANAATPIRYKMVFGEDIMVAFNQINGNKRDEGEILDISSQLAFIMHVQATYSREEIKGVTKEKYIEWLEDFGPMDFVNASKDIFDTYLGTTGTTSKSKNVANRRSEK